MFKVKEQLSNVRSAKSDVAEVSTTPTKGNIRLNSVAAGLMGITNNDYAAIVKAEDSNGEGIFICKGSKTEDGQFGSIVATATGKNGGSLLFSSENAYRNLGGNVDTKKVYTLGDSEVHEGVEYFRLNFSREEAKIERKAKA